MVGSEVVGSAVVAGPALERSRVLGCAVVTRRCSCWIGSSCWRSFGLGSAVVGSAVVGSAVVGLAVI